MSQDYRGITLDELYTTYPALFVQKDVPKSCMSYGATIGSKSLRDGHHDLHSNHGPQMAGYPSSPNFAIT